MGLPAGSREKLFWALLMPFLVLALRGFCPYWFDMLCLVLLRFREQTVLVAMDLSAGVVLPVLLRTKRRSENRGIYIQCLDDTFGGEVRSLVMRTS
jgi:hypothetical protein